jgi:hypothetical protein
MLLHMAHSYACAPARRSLARPLAPPLGRRRRELRVCLCAPKMVRNSGYSRRLARAAPLSPLVPCSLGSLAPSLPPSLPPSLRIETRGSPACAVDAARPRRRAAAPCGAPRRRCAAPPPAAAGAGPPAPPAPPAPHSIDAPCTPWLRHGDPMRAPQRLTCPCRSAALASAAQAPGAMSGNVGKSQPVALVVSLILGVITKRPTCPCRSATSCSEPCGGWPARPPSPLCPRPPSPPPAAAAFLASCPSMSARRISSPCASPSGGRSPPSRQRSAASASEVHRRSSATGQAALSVRGMLGGAHQAEGRGHARTKGRKKGGGGEGRVPAKVTSHRPPATGHRARWRSRKRHTNKRASPSKQLHPTPPHEWRLGGTHPGR